MRVLFSLALVRHIGWQAPCSRHCNDNELKQVELIHRPLICPAQHRPGFLGWILKAGDLIVPSEVQ